MLRIFCNCKMVFSADVHNPCRFEINRNLVGMLVGDMEMDDDCEDSDWDHRIERICIKIEAAAYYALSHYKKFSLTDLFTEAYEPPRRHA